jgi:hypothetical protein
LQKMTQTSNFLLLLLLLLAAASQVTPPGSQDLHRRKCYVTCYLTSGRCCRSDVTGLLLQPSLLRC